MKTTKQRLRMRLTKAAMMIAAFFMMTAPVTAYAGGYDCSCEEKCTEDHINKECRLCRMNPKLCYGNEPEEFEKVEETVSANEVPKEESQEQYGPLTPDGNLTLVDDYGSPERGKQFITMVTKSGNYFYLIIDRDDIGNHTVHFLNMVDESDLLALMDDDQVETYMAAKENGKEEKKTLMPEPEKPEPVQEKEAEPAEEKPQKKSGAGALAVLLLLGIGGAAGYVYLTKVKGVKKSESEYTDPDADYNEDEEDYLASLPEDEEYMSGDTDAGTDEDDPDTNESNDQDPEEDKEDEE